MARSRGTFKKGNKAAEKWTEEKLLKIAHDLLKWQEEKETNIFFKEFLLKHDLYGDFLSNMQDKYNSFNVLIKKARKVQEQKVVKWAMANKLNVTMAIFFLKNHHGYKDKSEVESKYTETELTTEERKLRIAVLKKKLNAK